MTDHQDCPSGPPYIAGDSTGLISSTEGASLFAERLFFMSSYKPVVTHLNIFFYLLWRMEIKMLLLVKQLINMKPGG